MSSKIYLFVFLILISCSNEPINEIKPKVIAYYTGNGDTINEFNLKGVDQIIYSFLHLKGLSLIHI